MTTITVDIKKTLSGQRLDVTAGDTFGLSVVLMTNGSPVTAGDLGDYTHVRFYAAGLAAPAEIEIATAGTLPVILFGNISLAQAGDADFSVVLEGVSKTSTLLLGSIRVASSGRGASEGATPSFMTVLTAEQLATLNSLSASLSAFNGMSLPPAENHYQDTLEFDGLCSGLKHIPTAWASAGGGAWTITQESGSTAMTIEIVDGGDETGLNSRGLLPADMGDMTGFYSDNISKNNFDIAILDGNHAAPATLRITQPHAVRGDFFNATNPTGPTISNSLFALVSTITGDVEIRFFHNDGVEIKLDATTPTGQWLYFYGSRVGMIGTPRIEITGTGAWTVAINRLYKRFGSNPTGYRWAPFSGETWG